MTSMFPKQSSDSNYFLLVVLLDDIITYNFVYFLRIPIEFHHYLWWWSILMQEPFKYYVSKIYYNYLLKLSSKIGLKIIFIVLF